jgi:succinate dehydrogenase cytochrome b subunit
MSTATRFYRSSLGKKYIMALTGVALFAFVIIHMLGNLQIFLGPASINGYAAFLKSKPGLLWAARAGLLAVAIMHIISALQVARANRAARPVDYVEKKFLASFAGQTILFSGIIIFIFIVYHLLHFTFGTVDPSLVALKDPKDPLRHDVYRMMISGFSNIGASVFYIVSMGLLMLHLSHGLSSMFQSLGLRRKAYARGIDIFAKTAATLIFLGNCAIPVAILAGWIK